MTDVGAGRIVAAFASLGAAATHVAVAPGHFADWRASGVFFFAIGAFQAGWALAAMRAAGPLTMVAGLLANAGSILLWAVSRTAGLPVGPHAGIPEQVDRVDLTTVAFEVTVCLLALWCLRSRQARGFRSSFSAAVMIGTVGAGVAGFTMPAVERAETHSHNHNHSPSHSMADESAPHSHDSGHETPAGTHHPGGGTAGPTPPADGPREHKQPAQPATGHTHAPGTAPHID